jgi:hypothetical protein
MRARNAVAGGAAAALLAAAGFGAVTWYRYGRARRHGTGHGPLDRFMPEFDVRERHEVRVRAPAEVTLAAARELDLHRAPLVRVIFRARQLFMGGRTAEAAPARPFLDEVLALGWRVLAEEPGRELVVGAVTRPWQADVVFRGLPAEEFAAFEEPGYVRIAWTLGVTPLGPDASLFHTETRAVATDPTSRSRFRRYWTLAAPGILLIRREMLRLVKREAERRAGVSGGRRTSAPRLEPEHPAPAGR